MTPKLTKNQRQATSSHSQHCPECKSRIQGLLERLYGTCLTEHRFPWSTSVSAYSGTSIAEPLGHIYAALQTLRGFENFVRADNLHPCDYFVPDPGFIVEFDEGQHFTIPRKIALSLYPTDPSLGYSTKRWIALCEQFRSEDGDPPYRDEQRAFYDSLRDLVPQVHGLAPTIRLYANDMQWCSLNHESTSDLSTFRKILESTQTL